MAKARHFTVAHPDGSEAVYSGFDRDFNPRELDHVVLVLNGWWPDGELDVYAVMFPDRLLGDFVRYLVDRGKNSEVVGVYSRKGT